MFKDREDAGQKLAVALSKYKGLTDALVMAIPRGGVVPGYIVARELKLPLDVMLVKKLGYPGDPELAIGAVSMDGTVVSTRMGVSSEYIREEATAIQHLLGERYRMYRGEKPAPDPRDKTVILVDDGVATGSTLIAAVKLLRRQQAARVIVAVPVAPDDTLERIRQIADEVICLESHEDFYAIGLYYGEFSQVSDEEVKRLLGKAEKATNG